jgi:hypothetical protein
MLSKRTTSLLAGLATTVSAAAALAVEPVIVNNGTYITATGVGFNGADISQAASTASIGLGFLATGSSGIGRIADDFTITNAPAGGQRLSTLEWYAFQTQTTNFTPNVTWTTVYVTLYSGDPASGGAVIAGDDTTNRLVSTTFTGIYRVGTGTSSSALMANNRPIQKIVMDMSWAPPLTDGTYWVSISGVGETTRTAAPFGVISTPFQPTDNGRQFFNGNWITLTGDFVFNISARCPTDFDGNGVVSIDDIFIFVNAWFANDPRADFDKSGVRTIDDIFIFINQWFTGC